MQKQAAARDRAQYVEEMHTQAKSLNEQLERDYAELDSLLHQSLHVDSFLDLSTLRVKATHPPFNPRGLDRPKPPPPAVQPPPEPQWTEPQTKGLGLFGKKQREEDRKTLWGEYIATHFAWEAELARIPTLQLEQAQAHEDAERARLAELEQLRKQYERQCAEREQQASSVNSALDDLAAGVRSGSGGAVSEYMSLVLERSQYPALLEIVHDCEFNEEAGELLVRVEVTPPSKVPSTKAFRYVKAADEISSTDLSQKAQKDRYASIVQQVALRTIREVFQADREEKVGTVSLLVGTEATEPATGHQKFMAFVAVAVDRADVEDIDWGHIVPAATLAHLGALISKNPHGLVSVDVLSSVRER